MININYENIINNSFRLYEELKNKKCLEMCLRDDNNIIIFNMLVQMAKSEGRAIKVKICIK